MTSGVYKRTEEHKKKIAKTLIGHKVSEETRRKISKNVKKHKVPKEIFKMKNMKEKCEICKDKKRLQVHHIDGNRQNNNMINLGIVCDFCHHAIHNNGHKGRFKISETLINRELMKK